MANSSNTSCQQARPEDEALACIQRYMNRGYEPPADDAGELVELSEPPAEQDDEPTARECIQRFYDLRRD